MNSEENVIAIHGLGYVGLTAAIHWAKAGWTVLAYDKDPAVVEALRAGTPKAGEFLGYLGNTLVEVGARILPTRDFEDTLVAPVHSIAVPTEREGVPFDGIVKTLLLYLFVRARSDATILVESTLTPGTLDAVLADSDIHRPKHLRIAACPRRDWFADPEKNLENLERIVGGVTSECTARAASLLTNVTKARIHLTDYRTAEITKALENAWLHALVMLPSEMAMNRPDLDVAEATRLASTHWRLPSIFLGAGCGGRCVPLGTKYLLEASGPGGVLDAVNKTERHIRLECARAVAQRKVKTALVLGIAYRPNFRDMGNSPGLDIARYLRRDFGVEVTVHDPMWEPQELANLTGFNVATERQHYDAVVLVTPHDAYLSPEFFPRIAPTPKFVLDAPGAWLGVCEEGCEYTRVGAPGWLKR